MVQSDCISPNHFSHWNFPDIQGIFQYIFSKNTEVEVDTNLRGRSWEKISLVEKVFINYFLCYWICFCFDETHI
jgi:hypothetical protein